MKTALLSSIVLAILIFQSHGNEAYWRPGNPYNTAFEDSPWETLELGRLEYRLLYLLDADQACHEALIELNRAGGEHSAGMIRARGSIDEVLETLYAEAVPLLKANPHPYLLTMMLYHYDRYVGSAMERWGPTIKALKALNEDATRYAEALARREHPSSEPECADDPRVSL